MHKNVYENEYTTSKTTLIYVFFLLDTLMLKNKPAVKAIITT